MKINKFFKIIYFASFFIQLLLFKNVFGDDKKFTNTLGCSQSSAPGLYVQDYFQFSLDTNNVGTISYYNVFYTDNKCTIVSSENIIKGNVAGMTAVSSTKYGTLQKYNLTQCNYTTTGQYPSGPSSILCNSLAGGGLTTMYAQIKGTTLNTYNFGNSGCQANDCDVSLLVLSNLTYSLSP